MTKLIFILAALVAAPIPQSDPIDRLLRSARGPVRMDATGFVTESGHPKHPGDVSRVDVVARLFVDPEVGEAVIEFDSGEGDEKETDRYFFRSGRIFQVGEDGNEVDPRRMGDVSPTTVAALHPVLVAIAMRTRPENIDPRDDAFFSWNDKLWEIDRDAGRIARLSRRTWHDLYGDGEETVRYQANADEYAAGAGRTRVTQGNRVVAELTFAAAVEIDSIACADGKREPEHERVIAYDELKIETLAPNIHKIDIALVNTRVVIAEFADYAFVFEGVYNSRNCDLVAKFVREKIGKPVRYFAFSHLHGQYIGGTRSWIQQGATILVPPTTRPMIDEIAQASFELHPDALSKDKKRPHVETIADRRVIEDATNALTIYNVESAHTDEYFVVYFPQAKILLTGDLLFYRPGQPLKGRSKLLCETVAKLGLDVDRYVATWPLEGYETKNIVSGEEMRAACAP